ncbi:hypothetical protein Bca52824_045470 [Brassica carinata]|uniref:Uncharacterized protein n=1 Tax=Brassica carinata TaxID=52824 RepID=A0A8X7RCK2_BRACI|nr:hypothetical protein Bca52824_045470 [Brassica carinata]
MATIMTKLLRLSTMSGKFQHKMRQTTPYSGPEAADVGFISGADITVGINISTQLKLTGVCLHDPLSFVEAVRPDLFKYKKGFSEWGLREYASATGSWIKPSSEKERIIDGTGAMSNPWVRFSPISVTWTINVDKVLEYIKVLVVKLISNLNSRLLAKL